MNKRSGPMIGCLILYHTKVTSLTKIKMLRFILKDEQFEINVVDNHTVIVFVWNVDKKFIFQTAVDFECASIATGYGFGKLKKEAEDEAKEKLQVCLYSSTGFPSVSHDGICPYKITS